LQVQQLVPELQGGRPEADVRARLAAVPWLLLLADEDGQIVGFKVGYQWDANTFYTWLGGVHPAYRRRGIAQALSR